jgi:hypothetical protein
MNIGNYWDVAPPHPQVGHDILKVGGIFYRGSSDPNDLTTDLNQFERLLDAFGGVHRITREHRLQNHWMLTTCNDAAPRRVAHNYWPAFSPAIRK